MATWCWVHFQSNVNYHYCVHTSSSLCSLWLGEGLSMLLPYLPILCYPLPLHSSDLFNHVCDLCLFSYPMFIFCPGMWCLTYSFPSLFVRLLACSLLGWWVPMFPRRVSLLEVCMNCRLVSSNIFQCYPWRCHGAWRMLFIRPWFFFESPCLCFCLWCCISVPDRCSFQCSRSECCWNILVCCFPSLPLSLTCSSSANSCSICRSSCGVLAHMSMSSAKWRWLRYSRFIFTPLVSQVSHQNMFLSAAINNLGNMVSPCHTPLLLLILLSI